MKLSQSRYFHDLLRKYVRAPSIALCRVPEMELLSRIKLENPALDHCCGDGYISREVFGRGTVEYGLDLSEKALMRAISDQVYHKAFRADLGVAIPYPDRYFSTVFNNSGVEHIRDLRTCLKEVSRVLSPGGRFYFNVLNQRYFDYWPLPPSAAAAYRAFQPFYHALDEEHWASELTQVGLRPVEFINYLERPAAQALAVLDYAFSAHYFHHRFSIAVTLTSLLPKIALRRYWAGRIGSLEWDAIPGRGAGFLCVAEKL